MFFYTFQKKYLNIINIILFAISFSTFQTQAISQENDKFSLTVPLQDEEKQNLKKKKLTQKEEASDQEAKRLMEGIDRLLLDAANQRNQAKKLPSRKDYFVAVPPWTETKEDRQEVIRNILDSVLQIVTEGPIIEQQNRLTKLRKNISTMKEQITSLREKRLDAPKDSLLPSIFTDTVSSIDDKIKELNIRIQENEKSISQIKSEIRKSFIDKDIQISESQLDLLLGSVISNDIVKLVAAFEAARIIDKRLGQLMAQNSESLKAARKYFAMHSALFAMLLHSQSEIINKIDKVYISKLDKILKELNQARRKTDQLLKQKNRPDQRRTLLANRKAQDFSEQVATFYRDYLKTQRQKISESRKRTIKDLSIADNTYETVEASFQLRALIEDSQSSFQALERLEAPGFGQVFQNDELRKEFEKLTDRLQVPSS